MNDTPSIVQINNKYIRVNHVVLNMGDISGDTTDIHEDIDYNTTKQVDAYFRYLYHEGFISEGQPIMINYKDVVRCGRFSLKYWNF